MSEDAVPESESILPTQAQLYDDLRRIGQLEDQKLAIQGEIDQRTERLRSAMSSLSKDSLLFKMLSSVLQPPPSSKRSTRRSKQKTPKRR